jgi:hypothetical protein
MQQLILVSIDHKSSLSKKKDKYIYIYILSILHTTTNYRYIIIYL